MNNFLRIIYNFSVKENIDNIFNESVARGKKIRPKNNRSRIVKPIKKGTVKPPIKKGVVKPIKGGTVPPNTKNNIKSNTSNNSSKEQNIPSQNNQSNNNTNFELALQKKEPENSSTAIATGNMTPAIYNRKQPNIVDADYEVIDNNGNNGDNGNNNGGNDNNISNNDNNDNNIQKSAEFVNPRYSKTPWQWLKSGQRNLNTISRYYKNLKGLGDAFKSLDDAARSGKITIAIDGFVRYFSDIASRSAYKLIQENIKKNFLKNIGQGYEIILPSNNSIINQIKEKYNNYTLLNNECTFKVINRPKLSYFNTKSTNMDQLWGQIYAEPTDEQTIKLFKDTNISYLYITFCAEDANNSGYIGVLDHKYKYINGIKQISTIFKIENNKLTISDYEKIDINIVMERFLNRVANRKIFETAEFYSLLYSCASNAIRLTGSKDESINEIIREFKKYFDDILTTTKSPISNLTEATVKKYFFTNERLSGGKNSEDIIRIVLNSIIKGLNNTKQSKNDTQNT